MSNRVAIEDAKIGEWYYVRCGITKIFSFRGQLERVLDRSLWFTDMSGNTQVFPRSKEITITQSNCPDLDEWWQFWR